VTGTALFSIPWNATYRYTTRNSSITYCQPLLVLLSSLEYIKKGFGIEFQCSLLGMCKEAPGTTRNGSYCRYRGELYLVLYREGIFWFDVAVTGINDLFTRGCSYRDHRSTPTTVCLYVRNGHYVQTHKQNRNILPNLGIC
jgi:hypothetical protein